jgi:hypothetical protein
MVLPAVAHVEGGSFCIFHDTVKNPALVARSARSVAPPLFGVHLCNIIRPDTKLLCFSVRAPVHLIPTIFLSVTLH